MAIFSKILMQYFYISVILFFFFPAMLPVCCKWKLCLHLILLNVFNYIYLKDFVILVHNVNFHSVIPLLITEFFWSVFPHMFWNYGSQTNLNWVLSCLLCFSSFCSSVLIYLCLEIVFMWVGLVISSPECSAKCCLNTREN